jgi:hypothetical protein
MVAVFYQTVKNVDFMESMKAKLNRVLTFNIFGIAYFFYGKQYTNKRISRKNTAYGKPIVRKKVE